jgi:hypothetical protein
MGVLDSSHVHIEVTCWLSAIRTHLHFLIHEPRVSLTEWIVFQIAFLVFWFIHNCIRVLLLSNFLIVDVLAWPWTSELFL